MTASTGARRAPAAPSGVDPHDGERLAAAGALAESIGQAMRALARARSQWIAQGGSDVGDYGAQLLLARLVVDGPRRVTDLADVSHCDASTVSRQVSSLVKHGLVDRRSDPADGRASLLVPTAAGHATYQTFRRGRTEDFARMLPDWAEDELRALSASLDRFVGDLVAYTAPAPTPSGGTSPVPTPSGGTSPVPTPSGGTSPVPTPSGGTSPVPTPSGGTLSRTSVPEAAAPAAGREESR